MTRRPPSPRAVAAVAGVVVVVVVATCAGACDGNAGGDERAGDDGADVERARAASDTAGCRDRIQSATHIHVEPDEVVVTLAPAPKRGLFALWASISGGEGNDAAAVTTTTGDAAPPSFQPFACLPPEHRTLPDQLVAVLADGLASCPAPGADRLRGTALIDVTPDGALRLAAFHVRSPEGATPAQSCVRARVEAGRAIAQQQGARVSLPFMFR